MGNLANLESRRNFPWDDEARHALSESLLSPRVLPRFDQIEELVTWLRVAEFGQAEVLAPTLRKIIALPPDNGYSSSVNNIRALSDRVLTDCSLHDPPSRVNLEKLFQSSDPLARQSAMTLCANSAEAGTRFAEHFRQALESPQPDDRNIAVSALQYGKNPSLRQHFAPYFIKRFLGDDRDSALVFFAQETPIELNRTLANQFQTLFQQAPQEHRPLIGAAVASCNGIPQDLLSIIEQNVTEILAANSDLGRRGAHFLNFKRRDTYPLRIERILEQGGNRQRMIEKLVADLSSDQEVTLIAQSLEKIASGNAKAAQAIAEALRRALERDSGSEPVLALAVALKGIRGLLPQDQELFRSAYHYCSERTREKDEPERTIGPRLDQLAIDLGVAPEMAAAAFARLKTAPTWERTAAEILQLCGLGPAAEPYAPQVAAYLKHPNRDMRRNVIISLAVLGETGAHWAPEAADELAACYEDFRQVDQAQYPSIERQVAANNVRRPDLVSALATMCTFNPAPLPKIVAMARPGNQLAKYDAALILGYAGEAARPFEATLVEWAYDRDKQISNLAMIALGRTGLARNNLNAINRLLWSADDVVRNNAATLIAEVCDGNYFEDSVLQLLDASYRYEGSRDLLVFHAYLESGASPKGLAYVRALANRNSSGPAPELVSPHSPSRFADLAVIVKATARYPYLLDLIARQATNLARHSPPRTDGELAQFQVLQDQLNEVDKKDAAIAMRQAVFDQRTKQSWLKTAYAVGIQISLWLLLLYVYPYSRQVQALFFWNPWIRRTFGLGYVDVVLIVVPAFRRRLFLPFRESLVPRRLLANYPEKAHYKSAEVLESRNGLLPNVGMPLVTAVNLRGQCVLIGRSGLGKTAHLAHLATTAKGIVVFLEAASCSRGVVEAIQKRLHGLARDANFLRSLIYSGAIDVLIDGLNEASPEARSQITTFVEQHFKGNFVLTTQPSEWRPPTTARVFELQPLRAEQIRAFMVSRWPTLDALAGIDREVYATRIQSYLAPAPDGPAQLDLAEKLVTLSNPMEAALAAELIAVGDDNPDHQHLIELRFLRMQRAYIAKYGKDFPRTAMAGRVVAWRLVDDPGVDVHDLEVEAAQLVEHNLLIRRSEQTDPHNAADERVLWLSRHDRIMDYLMLPAFRHEHGWELQVRHYRDSRFWGVYELLARGLPAKDETRLYEFLNEAAAEENENELRNRYERARRKRYARQDASASIPKVASATFS